MREASPEHVDARRALLDVLDVLKEHRSALTLVGAQAVYFHARGGVNLPTHTTDGDLAIDPDLLADSPDIAALLTAHGCVAGSNPGTWAMPNGVEIDLMVAASALGGSEIGAQRRRYGHGASHRRREAVESIVAPRRRPRVSRALHNTSRNP